MKRTEIHCNKSKSESPFVSVIIPCYNDSDYIEEAIQSAVNQTYKFKEIIVIDDGSNQKTKSVLKNLKHEISHLITQTNKGSSAARNVGIEAAQGELILTLDSDDLFAPTFCEKAVGIIRKDPDIKIVTCFAKRFNNKRVLDTIELRDADLKVFLKYNAALGNALFRKADYVNCGGYDEKMKIGYEDWEFYIRLLKSGGISKVIPETLFYYRQKPESNSTRASKVKYDLLRYIYLKHKDLYIDNYEILIDQYLSQLEFIERAGNNNLEKIEYKLGKLLLRPLRSLKNK